MTSTRRGWIHLASGAGVGRVFGFASNLLLSRWLGPTELGLFNLMTTTVQTSDTVVRCGGDYALNFELGGQPEATTTERGAELARGLVQLCSFTTALICILVVVWVSWGHGLFPRQLVGIQRFIMTGLLLQMIACEGISASAWEVLLVSRRTVELALRQGLFFPLRLLSSAVGALLGGVFGAMCGWSFIALLQCLWLRSILRDLWNPLNIWPLLGKSLRQLLKRGVPFYASNLLASLVFYPLLLKVSAGSGLSDIGYLRVGQVLQQLFAFLPATLVPVLFLKLRGESSFANKVVVMEKPLRIIWFFLLEILLLYCMVDKYIITWLFGPSFVPSLLPTRLLLITALFECIAQLVVQPLLAAGRTRLYGFWQNGAAALAALLGWIWIPTAGLAAYLIVRLLYVVVPLAAFGMPFLQRLYEPRKTCSLLLASITLTSLTLAQTLTGFNLEWLQFGYLILFMLFAILHSQDLLSLMQMMRRKA